MIYGKVGSQYFRVLNDKDNSYVEDNFAIQDSIKYDFDDTLDENQWFYIEKFKETQLIIEFIDDGLTSAGFDQILSKDFEKIKFLRTDLNNRIEFRKITSKLMIRRSRFISISNEPKIQEMNYFIQYVEEPDAVYLKENDTLYFKQISKLKGMIGGIESYVKEASDEEVNRFSNMVEIVFDNFNAVNLSISNRIRLRKIYDKYVSLNAESIKKLNEYCSIHLPFELRDNKFVIQNDKDFRNYLYALDQRFYVSEVYNETRIASSIRLLDNSKKDGQ